MRLETDEVASPVGAIRLAVHERRVVGLAFADCWPRIETALVRRFGEVTYRPARDPAGVASALRAYLRGALDALDAVVADTGGTPFQRRVWEAMRAVPPGRTTAYGTLARDLGAPAAVRAVGAASGANPVWIVVPCHRVVGAGGALTGYGGGLARKRWLLAHEAGRPTQTGRPS
jgi:methylated-DNA-[protein]-cysteine S-methyltransferase